MNVTQQKTQQENAFELVKTTLEKRQSIKVQATIELLCYNYAELIEKQMKKSIQFTEFMKLLETMYSTKRIDFDEHELLFGALLFYNDALIDSIDHIPEIQIVLK